MVGSVLLTMPSLFRSNIAAIAPRTGHFPMGKPPEKGPDLWRWRHTLGCWDLLDAPEIPLCCCQLNPPWWNQRALFLVVGVSIGSCVLLGSSDRSRRKLHGFFPLWELWEDEIVGNHELERIRNCRESVWNSQKGHLVNFVNLRKLSCPLVIKHAKWVKIKHL